MTKEELKQEFEKYFEQKNNEGYLWVSQEMEQIELKDCCETVCFDFAEPREKKIAELEKENAELEKQLEEADNATDCFNRQEEIIEKAKEIIKEFLSYYHSNNYPYQMLEILDKAEQFISEVEK